MYIAVKKEQKVQQGKQDKISSDKLNGYICPYGARYTEMCVKNNVLISQRMMIPSNPLVPEVADVAASAVSDVNNVVPEECDYVLCLTMNKYVKAAIKASHCGY